MRHHTTPNMPNVYIVSHPEIRFDQAHFLLLGSISRSKHRLQVISDLEGCLSLALHLIHRYTVSDLDQGQASCEVDVKDTLANVSSGFGEGY